MKYPVIVGSNCCAGNFYHNYLNTPFYSPFIWSVVPYDSLLNLASKWTVIDWNDIKLVPNPTREFTLTLQLNKIANIHYVHYFWSDKHSTPYAKGASIFYKDIHKYLLNKYKERVSRMLNDGLMESPIFIVHEEQYDNEKHGDILPQIMELKTPYKRIVITHTVNLSSIKTDDNCLYIYDGNKMLPEPMILKYGDKIAEFCGINKVAYKQTDIILPAQ